MKTFFKVSHGMDNYEEIVRFEDISFVITYFVYGGEGNDWDNKVKILFKNGKERIIHFSDEGYKQFSEKLLSEEVALNEI